MPPVLEMTGVVKDYRSLRPFRIDGLSVSRGEVVAIAGPDQAAAEVLTNLVTGAALPDEGRVRVFGQDTHAIQNADAWLTGLDRFGIVSDRVALLEGFSLRQNIAIAMTLDLEPLGDEVARGVGRLAAEAGLHEAALDAPAGESTAAARLRARVARAIASDPHLLLVEHPTGSLPREDVAPIAADLVRLVRARGLSALIVSADRDFTRAADRQLTLDASTGVLRRHGLRAWFR